MVEVTDYKAFGDLLSRRKFATEKTFRQLAKEMKISSNTIQKWHEWLTLPKAGKLPRIALVYQVSLEELEVAYELAKTARRRVGTKCRAEIRPKYLDGSGVEPNVYSSIADRQTLIRTNSQLPNWRFGRS